MDRLRKNKKGFTLVEIIVVLVILAILAVIAIPTMLGYVDEARGKALTAEARAVYVSAQAVVTEKTALGDWKPEVKQISYTGGADNNSEEATKIATMSGVPEKCTFTITIDTTNNKNKITKVTYTQKSGGKTITLNIPLEGGEGSVVIS